jgi:hypothetical protein
MTGSRRRRVLVSVIILLTLSGFTAPLGACNVPVFRYALEHWSPDTYQALVFHRGPLTAEQQAAVAKLETAANSMNLAVRTIDLAHETDAALPEQASRLPWLVVRYPAAAAIVEPVWSGPLQAGAIAGLIDSPARREIRRRILEGESAVWVLLDGGATAQDDPAEALLRSQLDNLQHTMKLPERTDAPEDHVEGEDQLPVRLAFSALRVRRDDPAEALLVRLLLHSEPDLAGRREPMIFPVFGRGRILYALVGAGITEGNLRETASFLTGACSCRVKKETPGIDLLLPGDWPAAPEKRRAEEESLSPEEGYPLAAFRGEAAAEPAEEKTLRASPPWLLSLGGAAALVSVLGLWYRLAAVRRTARTAGDGPRRSANGG